MSHGHRSVITMGFTSNSDPILSFLASHDWTVTQLLDSPNEVGSQSHKLHCAVGIVDLRCFSASDDIYKKVYELTSEHSKIKWLGLVPPALVNADHVKQLLSTVFYDYQLFPVNKDTLLSVLEQARELASLNDDESDDLIFGQAILGHSSLIRELRETIKKVAKVDSPVLITGETGTGKELIAHAIHGLSHFASNQFIAVNCGGIVSTLIQAELFGHEKGAFTGAHYRKKGYIESADGGTLFLDEIGELPMEEQSNLLRFLQEGTIHRVGSTESIKVDVRVIAATNIDIEKAIRNGMFREDLYYRLNVLEVKTPPLRERSEDIELLAYYFLDKFSLDFDKKVRGFSDECLEIMKSYPWKGNIRELMNRIKRAVVMTDKPLISSHALGICESPEKLETGLKTFHEAREDAEIKIIKTALQHSKNNVTLAAQRLKISRAMLYRLLSRYQIKY